MKIKTYKYSVTCSGITFILNFVKICLKAKAKAVPLHAMEALGGEEV
jgi:hypothetical protein